MIRDEIREKKLFVCPRCLAELYDKTTNERILSDSVLLYRWTGLGGKSELSRTDSLDLLRDIISDDPQNIPSILIDGIPFTCSSCGHTFDSEEGIFAAIRKRAEKEMLVKFFSKEAIRE